MKRVDHYDGSERPFEGELSLTLCSIPVGARIESARIRLEPVDKGESGIPFGETLSFNGGRGEWGATLSRAPGWVEVNFHTRRTLVQVTGEELSGATLQIDLGGGTYAEVNSRGGFAAPGDEPFTLPAGGRLPPLTVTRFRLLTSDEKTPDIYTVTIRSAPSNLRLHPGNQPPIWNRPGELTAPQTSPEIGAALQALLAETAAENGYYAIPLSLHSDTLGRIRMTVEIDYVMEAELLPAGLEETTLPFGHETLPDSDPDVLQVTLPPDAEVLPGETRLRLSGAFEETRIVYGPLGRVKTPVEVVVSPDRSQARPLTLEEPLAATAVDLRLAAVSRNARLQLDLRGDLDGRPDARSLLPEAVTFSLERRSNGGPGWISIPLPREFQFEGAGRRYWLILQSLEGEAVWYAAPAEEAAEGMRFTDNGGLSWRRTTVEEIEAPLAGALRLRRRPERFQVPLALEVGRGPTARRVGLDRFGPLGRVDFPVDIPDLAAAFNGYLRDHHAAACIEQELVADGGFDRWLCKGEPLSTPLETALAEQPAQIAVSPRGDDIYLALHIPGGTAGQGGDTRLVRITPGGNVTILVEKVAGKPLALAAGPEERLHLVTDAEKIDFCHTFDGSDGRHIGRPKIVEDGVVGMAVSPDGMLLYLIVHPLNGNEGKVLVYDAGAPEAPLLTLSFPSGHKPRALAFANTPSGPLLLVLVNAVSGEERQGRLYRYETVRHTRLGEPLQFGHSVTSLAASPGGDAAVVGLVDDTLQTVDLERWQTGTVIQLNETPAFVRLSPDGTRAYVVEQNQSDRLRVVDLSHARALDAKDIEGTVTDLAIAADGCRLFCATITKNTLYTFELGDPLPLEWMVMEGHVGRRFLPPPFGPVAEVGDGDGPTTLLQSVPFAPGCDIPWRFGFWGAAGEPGAIAELAWQDARCGLLRRDRLPIRQVVQPPQTLYAVGTRSDRSPLFPHQLEVTPPPDASQVEIRFHVPYGRAVIDRVSLKVRTLLSRNDTLQLDENGLPFHWQPGEETRLKLERAALDQPLCLTNTGDRPGTLTQEVTVTPGDVFRLEFRGRAASATGARIGIRWKRGGKEGAASPVSLPVEPHHLECHGATGTVPDGTREAELFITLPPDAKLFLERLTLRRTKPVTVPLIPLAHAPGELTVTQARVVYDRRPPASTAVPGSTPAPCPPAATASGARTTGEDSAYCPTCRAVTRLRNRLPAVTPAGRPVSVGVCRRCNGIVILPGAGAARIPLSRVIRKLIHSNKTLSRGTKKNIPSHILPLRKPRPAGNDGESLLRIKGIGPARARLLHAAGITSVEKLAALQPARLEQILKNISPRQARDIIAAAKGI